MYPYGLLRVVEEGLVYPLGGGFVSLSYLVYFYLYLYDLLNEY